MSRTLLPAILLALLLAPHASLAASTSRPVVAVPNGWPKLLTIPRLGIKAPVESDPLTKLKPIDQQPRWGDVLWYSRSVKPGEQGHALIIGHLDTYNAPAVFWNLRALKTGDKFTFGYNRGTLTFQVTWVKSYANNAVPNSWIYGWDNQRGVVLETCSGLFHGLNTGGYDHRLIVYARLVLPNGHLA